MLSMVKSPPVCPDPAEGLSTSSTYLDRPADSPAVVFHLNAGLSWLVYELSTGSVRSTESGAVASIVIDPADEKDDSFPEVSAALTRKYQVPSERAVAWVNEFVVEVVDEIPLVKPADCDH